MDERIDRALLWEDRFEGPADAFPDPAIWTPELGGGGWGNREVQTYTSDASNVALDGLGHLVIFARADADGEWTSARITTFGKRTVRYGLIEVRAHLPSGAGIWPAAWTLGRNIRDVGWPRCGEIDIIESIGDATKALQTVHGPRGCGVHWQGGPVTALDQPLSDGFHAYSADWDVESITFALDGRVTGVVSAADVPADGTWPFTEPQYVLLNVAVGGDLPGPPDASTPGVAAMAVDWVRAYQPALNRGWSLALA